MDLQTASILNATAKEDFNGHTEFVKLTLEQRIAWVSQMARLWYFIHPKIKSTNQKVTDVDQIMIEPGIKLDI